jgi:hypothetical protein
MALRSGESATTLVTTRRGSDHQRDGRLGHELKNILSGAILASLFRWSYVPPSAVGARGFREVDEVIELERLAPVWPRLRMRGGQYSLPSLAPASRTCRGPSSRASATARLLTSALLCGASRVSAHSFVRWRKQGACPESWTEVTLNGTGFAGIDSMAALRTHLRSARTHNTARSY